MRAYETADKDEIALATYEAYLTTPWLWRYENDAVELGYVLRRKAELHELLGETEEAARAYADLMELWRQADGPAAREAEEIRIWLARFASSK